MSKTYDKDADDTAVVVRSGACLIKSIKVAQRAAAASGLFLQLFNAAAATPGTTAPTAVLRVPAGNSNMDNAFNKYTFSGPRGGLYFDTGLTYCVTTTHDNGTAPTGGQEPELEIQWEPVG